jgi:DNA-binding NarL/FixJ family response regulator
MRILKPIRVGLMADEPMVLEGLASILNEPQREGQVKLIPVAGSMKELLADASLEYLLIDLKSSSSGRGTLEMIRKMRPALRLIVIGPEGNDELVMGSIVSGARAYLNLLAGPEMVRQALEMVIAGYIWAPRRLLSKLIDRLLAFPNASFASVTPQLTDRERQVLDLILMARSNREIARQLGIEERTVKAYVGSLMRKTGVDNRIELSMRALNLSLASRPSDNVPSEPGARRQSSSTSRRSQKSAI